jgi:hypothetical protein
MEDIASLLNSIFTKAVDYTKTSIELVKLKAVDRVSDAVSTAVPHAIVLCLICLALLFLSLGLSFWIGDLLGKTYLGFLVVGGFFLLVGLILRIFFHGKIKKMVSNYLVNQLLN